MSNHDDRPKPPDTAARLNRSPAQHKESERMRAFETVEATFPPPTTATPDELVQMAVHALGFDAAGLAASLGISRAEGETLMRNPSTVSRRHRALLAQYLEMRGDARTATRNRAIALKLRELAAQETRAADAERARQSPPPPPAD